MRISMIHAPEELYDQNYGNQFTPLWAYTLAAHIPAHWEIEVIDCRLEDLDRARDSDIFAFSGMNQDLASIERAAERLRARYPQALQILGGPITWSFEQEGKLGLLDRFDHVFILDGEEALPKFLAAFEAGTHAAAGRVIRGGRFPVARSRVPRLDLLDRNARRYYGAVIEVSRGCPFLCEFCDIRVLPGNNETHVRPVAQIIEELEHYRRLGIHQVQFACDNFIGSLRWAEECVDAILAWRERTGAQVSIFTWLTINLYKSPRLMDKMRRAGFTVLFIGVESVNRHSLLEAAKVQNVGALEEAIRTIHEHGFVIAPGLIFGFDSDTPDVFERTLEFLRTSGLLGGDPSFLSALAGTPLYARMKEAGRLVERAEGAIERHKIRTNVRYLHDADLLAEGFLRFLAEFTSSRFQQARFDAHLGHLRAGGSKAASGAAKGGGYARLAPYLWRQFRHPLHRRWLLKRVSYLLAPRRTWTAARALARCWWLGRTHGSLTERWLFWLYGWTNLALKYEGLARADMELHSVEAAERPRHLGVLAARRKEGRFRLKVARTHGSGAAADEQRLLEPGRTR